ncbi:hypothetical protein [Verrucosispora sp. TAA-831]|uniref:hypothetical protein n=1 Tax=Verrucosispora sp. TAA-831 TaxID=3422227 RepID=UPI003D6E67DB
MIGQKARQQQATAARYAVHVDRYVSVAARLPHTADAARRSRLMLHLSTATHYRAALHDQVIGAQAVDGGIRTMREAVLPLVGERAAHMVLDLAGLVQR